MLTKQQIADEFKALEAELHAQCTREWNSTHRHVLIKQSEKRRELQDACGLSGHIFKINGRCRDCGASNDRPAKLATFTSADQTGRPIEAGEVFRFHHVPQPVPAPLPEAGLSEHKPSGAARWVVSADPGLVPGEWACTQPAPDVISKAPDALPACLSEPHTLTGGKSGGSDALPAEDSLSWFDRVRFVALYGRY